LQRGGWLLVCLVWRWCRLEQIKSIDATRLFLPWKQQGAQGNNIAEYRAEDVKKHTRRNSCTEGIRDFQREREADSQPGFRGNVKKALAKSSVKTQHSLLQLQLLPCSRTESGGKGKNKRVGK